MNISSGLLAFIFGAISIVLSFVLVRKSGQLRASESELETARKETTKARTEASKATAEKEASSVSAEIAKQVSKKIFDLIKNADDDEDIIEHMEQELELANKSQCQEQGQVVEDAAQKAAIEVAKQQALFALSKGMTLSSNTTNTPNNNNKNEEDSAQ